MRGPLSVEVEVGFLISRVHLSIIVHGQYRVHVPGVAGWPDGLPSSPEGPAHRGFPPTPHPAVDPGWGLAVWDHLFRQHFEPFLSIDAPQTWSALLLSRRQGYALQASVAAVVPPTHCLTIPCSAQPFPGRLRPTAAACCCAGVGVLEVNRHIRWKQPLCGYQGRLGIWYMSLHVSGQGMPMQSRFHTGRVQE